MLANVNLDDDIDKYWTNATKVLDNDVYDLEEFSFLEKSVNLEEMGRKDGEGVVEEMDKKDEGVVEEDGGSTCKRVGIDNADAENGFTAEMNDANNVSVAEKNGGGVNGNDMKVEAVQQFINFSSLDDDSFSVGGESNGMISDDGNYGESADVAENDSVATKENNRAKHEKEDLLVAEVKSAQNAENVGANLRELEGRKKRKSFFDFNTMKKVELMCSVEDDTVNTDETVKEEEGAHSGAQYEDEDLYEESSVNDYSIDGIEHGEEYGITYEEDCTSTQQSESTKQIGIDTSIVVDGEERSHKTSEEKSKTRMKGEKIKDGVSAMPMRKSVKRKVLQNRTNIKKLEGESKRERRSSSNESMDSNVLSNISSRQSKNGFVPLVIESNLETAILNLQENAYIEDDSATKSFSFYVTKGKFTIKRGEKEFTLKRDGMLVINEGESFVCKGMSRGGNTGIVTYKIT